MREITDRWERALASGARLGEGARWDETSGLLYWVDIQSHEVHRFDPASGKDEFFRLWDTVGMIALTNGTQLVAAVGPSVFVIDEVDAAFASSGATGHQQPTPAAIERDDPRVRLLAPLDDPSKKTRANDGVVDPAGRLFVGTMSLIREEGAGSLYRLSSLKADVGADDTAPTGGTDNTVAADGSGAAGATRAAQNATVDHVAGGIGVSNGIGWNPDQTRMYYIDTHTHRVDVFDYDRATGAVSNRRPFITVPEELGRPDGMTTDAQGDLWVAMWQGDAVTHWSGETGELIEVFRLPAARITSVAFGGPEFRDLYATSAADDQENPPGPGDHEPKGGDLFVIRDVGPGAPGFRFAL